MRLYPRLLTAHDMAKIVCNICGHTYNISVQYVYNINLYACAICVHIRNTKKFVLLMHIYTYMFQLNY